MVALRGRARDVRITGLGAVSAFGWSVDDLEAGLDSGRCAIGEPQRLEVAGHRTRIASEVPGPPSDLPRGIPGWERLTQADRFAVVAAREAVRRSGAGALIARDPERCGVFFGGSTAGMAEAERWFERLLETGRGGSLRALASQQLNAPGDAVARDLRVQGPVVTLSSACASGALALAAALDALRSGEVDLAVAGGSDSLCQLTYAGFNALRAVDERPCRPFRVDRAGLSLGEGSGVVVLERGATADGRGAPSLALLLGAGASCDAHHMTAPHPEGEGAERAIRTALADADLEAEDLDFVNAHGTGTPHNDGAEARAVAAVAGPGSLPITSTKGAVGHLLGSAGALEAVAAILAIRSGRLQPTAGGEVGEVERGVDLVVGSARRLPANRRHGLSTNFAFGGANAALIFGPPETADRAT